MINSKEAKLGYLAAMIDRCGYIGITGKVGGRLRPEVSITTKNSDVADMLKYYLVDCGIDCRIKTKMAFKSGLEYSSYQVVVGKLDNLLILAKLTSDVLVDPSRMVLLGRFVKSRVSDGAKGKGYTDKEVELKLELDKLNKIHKKLR